LDKFPGWFLGVGSINGFFESIIFNDKLFYQVHLFEANQAILMNNEFEIVQFYGNFSCFNISNWKLCVFFETT
jgi:hypothetical protein